MHIGIILDGNRRFAKSLDKKPWEGHELGAKKVEEILSWAQEFGINEMTIYCFSTENFNRPKEEVDFIMMLFKKWFRKFLNDKRLMENKIRVKFIGKRELLNKELQKIIRELEEKTQNNDGAKINFALAYGGRQEILSAIEKLVKSGEEINEENFRKNLWLSDEPDFIIRTGGEKRTSNFLPWQSAYSEWIFFDKMWPEITKGDFKTAIEEFKNRERRFGK